MRGVSQLSLTILGLTITTAFGKELQCFITGSCTQSNLLAEDCLPTVDECSGWCNQFPQCAWFTFYDELAICTLMDGCAELTPNPGATSGMKGCERRCSIPGLCQGKLLGLSSATSEAQCLAKCQESEDCQWYSFDSSNGACHQFEDCPKLDLESESCLSGERKCLGKSSPSKFLLALGATKVFDEIDTVDFVDLHEPSRSCRPLPSTPTNTSGSVGGFVSGRPIYCGGFKVTNGLGNNDDTTECFELVSEGWRPMASMNTERQDAAATLLPGGTWWVTGGFEGNVGYHNSTEELIQNSFFTSGPRLPDSMAGHCIVRVNSTMFYLIGGSRSNGNASDVTIYDWFMGRFTKGQSMLTERSEHGCGLVTDPVSGQDHLMVVGGSRYETRPEIYDFESNSWHFRSAPDEHVVRTEAVSVDGDLYLLFGTNNASNAIQDIQKYDFKDDSWSPIEGWTASPRLDFITIQVPDDFC